MNARYINKKCFWEKIDDGIFKYFWNPVIFWALSLIGCAFFLRFLEAVAKTIAIPDESCYLAIVFYGAVSTVALLWSTAKIYFWIVRFCLLIQKIYNCLLPGLGNFRLPILLSKYPPVSLMNQPTGSTTTIIYWEEDGQTQTITLPAPPLPG